MTAFLGPELAQKNQNYKNDGGFDLNFLARKLT